MTLVIVFARAFTIVCKQLSCQPKQSNNYTAAVLGLYTAWSSSIIIASSIVVVGDYFTKVDNGSNAQCNDCELKLAIADESTSYLRRHLQKRHSIENLGNPRK